MGILKSFDDVQKVIENVIQPSGVATGTSNALSNGGTWTFNISTTNTGGAITLVAPDITLYLTSVSAANQFPDGSNIDMSQWQIVGPWNDWGDTDNINTFTRIFIRNISAGASKTIVLKVNSRAISNTISNVSQ